MAEKLLEKPADTTGKRRYTNSELASLYYNLKMSLSAGPFGMSESIRAIKQKIANSPVDINGLYLEKGSLDSLAVPGVGKDAKATLKGILENGANGVRQKTAEKAGRQSCGFASHVKLRLDDEERRRYPGAED